jgi:hypothetical protein
MNERIYKLARQADTLARERVPDLREIVLYNRIRDEKFAELIVQDCANFVRETYDHEAAESIAWTMEINYGLHGDYA